MGGYNLPRGPRDCPRINPSGSGPGHPVRAATAAIILLFIFQTPDTANAAQIPDKTVTLHADNADASGLWASATHFYVSDPDDDNIYAYLRADGSRDATKEIALTSDAEDAAGIWSDGTTLWVADDTDHKLYAYTLSSRARDNVKDITLSTDNTDPKGIWGVQNATLNNTGHRRLDEKVTATDDQDNRVGSLSGELAPRRADDPPGESGETRV